MAFKYGKHSSIPQPIYCTLVQLPSVSTHKSTALNLHRVRNVNILYSKWHNGFCTVTLISIWVLGKEKVREIEKERGEGEWHFWLNK